MHLIHDYLYNVWFMKKVLHTIWFLFLLLTIVHTTLSQDDMLLVSEKNEFSEVRFFGVGGVNYLMKDNPNGKQFGVGLDVGLYYRTSRFFHIGLTMGLHGAHNTSMQSDFDIMTEQNKIVIYEMSKIDFSHTGYLIPLAVCARFDVANKGIIPFVRLDAGVNYTFVDAKGVFTKIVSSTSEDKQQFTESYGYIAPMLALAVGVDYPINSSFAVSGILKLHTTYNNQTRNGTLRNDFIDFSPKYTILSVGITKKM